MMNMRRSWLAAALPGVVLLPACSEEVKDINRVQPGYIEKSALEGEWYYRQTVVDVPPDVGIGFVGLEGKLEKVRFEVQSGAIVVRRIHESIEGLDEDMAQPGSQFTGDVVATLSTSTFDITRDYNRSSGSQSNVLNENSGDRPWWEHKFLRPDWSSMSGVGPVDFVGLFSGIATNSYFVPQYERFNPDHLQVDPGEGVINFTQAYAVTDGGQTCFLEYGFYRSTTNTRNSCGLGEVKIRHSFVRIDPEDAAQFEPRRYFDREVLRDDDGHPMTYVTVSVPDGQGENEYIDVECTEDTLAQLAPKYSRADCKPLSGPGMNRFGFFRTERFEVDRRIQSGHDELRNFYANHHKIWKQVYEWDFESDGKTIKKDGRGKPMVKRDSKGEPVRIPVANRKVHPIVYHLNVNFPEDLKATAQKIAEDWDTVFVNAIASAKGISVSALRAEIAADDPEGKNTAYRIEDNSCRKPVIDAYLARVPELQDVADDATTGEGVLAGNLQTVCAALESESADRGLEKFKWQQVGDASYSFVFWVNENQPSGPLGFGPSGPDPESGRILSGNAYVYGAAVDEYARGSMDMVRFLNGDIQEQYGDEYLPITDGKTVSDWFELRKRTRADEPAEVSDALRTELGRRFSPYQLKDAETVRFENGKVDLSKVVKNMSDRARQRDPADPFYGVDNRGDSTELLKERLREDPVLRSRMVPQATMALVERLFQWKADDHAGEDMPTEMLDIIVELAVNPRAISEHMHKRTQFYLERNITLPEFIDDSVYGTALSLKGRSPEEVYQTLREEIFRGVMLHEIGHTLGMTHNFRASADALNYFDKFWEIEERFDSEEEREENLQPEYRYTSIMDYGARFNSDFQGLGKYDQAAIKFAYTGLVEKFEDDVPLPGRLDMHLEFDHYHKIPGLLGDDLENLKRREDIPADEATEALRDGVRENGVLYAENPTRAAKDYWIDRTVPYFYCYDYYNGNDPRCRTWDEGPSYEASVRSAIQRFWNYYFFNNYRRGRDEYQFLNSYFARIDRVMPYLEFPFQAYAFLQQFTNRDGEQLDVAEDLLKASMITSDFMLQVLGTPDPGPKCRLQISGGFNPDFKYMPATDFLDYPGIRDCQANGDYYDVPLGVGRGQFLDLSDDYSTRYEYIGTFYEKQYMLLSLLNSGLTFAQLPGAILASYDAAGGQFGIRFGYFDVFSESIVGLVNSMLNSSFGYLRWSSFDSGDFGDAFASRPYHTRVTKDEDGNIELQYPRFFDYAAVDPRLPTSGGSGFGDDSTELWAYIPYDLGNFALYAGTQLNSRVNDDRLDFYQYVAIEVVGSGSERSVSPRNPNADVVEFTNPKTGETFRAYQTEDGRSMAVELLRRANGVADDWTAAEANAENDPGEFNNQDAKLEFYLGLVQDFRLLRSVMDLGK
jgi:hypothetical protein